MRRSSLTLFSPRKRFGQHFLVDRHYIERIVAALDPQPGDNLVEIGPGLGALTGPLLERVERLTVIEIDRDLASHLAATYPAAVISMAILRLRKGSILEENLARTAGSIGESACSPLPPGVVSLKPAWPSALP